MVGPMVDRFISTDAGLAAPIPSVRMTDGGSDRRNPSVYSLSNDTIDRPMMYDVRYIELR